MAILFALIALTDPRFSQLTVSHFVLIISATFLLSEHEMCEGRFFISFDFHVHCFLQN